MKAFKLKHAIPELSQIDSVADLGATVVDGDPQAAVATIYGKPGDALTCGLFSATQGSFRMTSPFTEHATVLEGVVDITDDASGKTERYQAGDGWFIRQGTVTTWKVLSGRMVKHYLAQRENVS